MSKWDAKIENFKDVEKFRLFEGVATLTLNGWVLFWKEGTYFWKTVIHLYFYGNSPFSRLITKREAFTLIKLRHCKALRKRWGFFRKLLTMTKKGAKKKLEEEVEKHYILEKLR